MKRIKLIFAWYDLWIGIFIDTKRRLVYIFLIPMIGIVIDTSTRKSRGEDFCQYFTKKKSIANCHGQGHYLCDECTLIIPNPPKQN